MRRLALALAAVPLLLLSACNGDKGDDVDLNPDKGNDICQGKDCGDQKGDDR